MAKLSVLMSIYIKEKPEYVDKCFQSLLAQTVSADEWVIVEDGPLSEKMYRLLQRYETAYPGLIKRIPLKKNQGLGLALRIGITKCTNELIARMDTDDIAREDRFEKQLAEFCKDSQLDICGSHIIEFMNGTEHAISKRCVPLKHQEIVKYQKKRSAFNHMTVMYKKSTVLKSGNYEHCPQMEDDMLWTRMILGGAKCLNIDDFLVYARAGKEMIQRRGGFTYFKKYKSGKRRIMETGFNSRWEYYQAICIQFIVAILPNRLRLLLFVRFLRT